MSEVLETPLAAERKKPGPKPAPPVQLNWRQQQRVVVAIKAAFDRAGNATRLAWALRVWMADFERLSAHSQRDVIDHYARIEARNEEWARKYRRAA